MKLNILLFNKNGFQFRTIWKSGWSNACQHVLELFIKNTQNETTKRHYCVTLYIWCSNDDLDVDELFEKDYEKSLFILDILEKCDGNLTELHLLYDYCYALESLQYQKKLWKIKNIKKNIVFFLLLTFFIKYCHLTSILMY